MDGYKFLKVYEKDDYGNPIGHKHLALVKLEIPNDATVIYPVDKDYYYGSSFSDEELYKMTNYIKAKKCRCSKAKIVEVIKYYNLKSYPSNYFGGDILLYSMPCDLQPSDLIFISLWNPNFIYPFNEYVKPDSLNEDILWECSNGIHFFRTIEDTIDYIETSGCTIMDKEV